MKKKLNLKKNKECIMNDLTNVKDSVLNYDLKYAIWGLIWGLNLLALWLWRYLTKLCSK